MYGASLRLIDWLIVPLKNFSLTWKRHHYRWRATKFRPMLGVQGLWAGRDLYRTAPAVTPDLGFSGLIRKTAPFSCLLWHIKSCGGSILTRILTGTHSVALYDTQRDVEDLFLPWPSQVACLKRSNNLYGVLALGSPTFKNIKFKRVTFFMSAEMLIKAKKQFSLRKYLWVRKTRSLVGNLWFELFLRWLRPDQEVFELSLKA
jgi:hypothetical protein